MQIDCDGAILIYFFDHTGPTIHKGYLSHVPPPKGDAVMPTFAKKQAVKAIAEEVRKSRLDDLVEIYNELFPRERTTMEAAGHDPGALTARILQHIEAGLEIEEVIDLYWIMFPEYRRLEYDEETNRFHCEKREEGVEAD